MGSSEQVTLHSLASFAKVILHSLASFAKVKIVLGG